MERSAAVTGSTWRIPVVVIVASLFAMFSLPDIALPWHPFSDFGMQVDASATIIGVDRDRSAGRAGVEVGDRVDLAATPIGSRRFLITGFGGAAEGTRADFAIVGHGRDRTVSLVAEPRPRTFADNASDVALMLAYAATLAICSALVLLRPSKMTWAFFFYGCSLVGQSVLSGAFVPLWLYVFDSVVMQTINTISWFPLALFALRFPNDAATGWRRVAQAVLLLGLVVLFPFAAFSSSAVLFGIAPPDLIFDVVANLAVAGMLFVAVTFAITYVHSVPVDRARLRWVIAGLIVGDLSVVVTGVLGSVPGLAVALPIWAQNTVNTFTIAVPVTVAYAVIRHRVFDVRFVIGRAVVYGLLTTTLLVTVALLDYVVGQLLSQTHLATIVEVLASIVIGLSLNSLHKRVEAFVDATLFRGRRRAELRLRRIGRGLMHSGDERAITKVIVEEPAAAYALASAALFKRGDDGTFVREHAIGWDGAHLERIDSSASMILQLQSSRGPVAAHDAVWDTNDLPHGLAAPAFAFPIFARERVEAVVFYGPHASGEDLDPEEREVLEELMRSASAAYDHAAAEIAREKFALLESEIAMLRSLVAVDA
jgi:hypothetical protein